MSVRAKIKTDLDISRRYDQQCMWVELDHLDSIAELIEAAVEMAPEVLKLSFSDGTTVEVDASRVPHTPGSGEAPQARTPFVLENRVVNHPGEAASVTKESAVACMAAASRC